MKQCVCSLYEFDNLKDSKYYIKESVLKLQIELQKAYLLLKYSKL